MRSSFTTLASSEIQTDSHRRSQPNPILLLQQPFTIAGYTYKAAPGNIIIITSGKSSNCAKEDNKISVFSVSEMPKGPSEDFFWNMAMYLSNTWHSIFMGGALKWAESH